MKYRGKVKWFNAAKGYGFVQKSDEEKDIFVHFSSIMQEGYKSLNKDDQVEFEIVNTPKGEQAANVMRIQ